ncbi:LPS assembly lipoprotein LptE [Desulfogranum japonicum]|uniref:LPS assembly lipoprotein LptE n=1 Tax=Desulfogranum japonicum TaxID=231447 RepID=UPI00048D1E5B|nr:LPS assembly lipoprotein LptE [Desulfogranum japonicum]
MTIHRLQICLFALITLCLTSCSAYYFPHVYHGPERTIYMPTWQNRTNKLGLDAKIYQELSRWFRKADSVNLTKDRESADLILAGEINYIELPSVSWDGSGSATDVKVRLGVRYVLKDIQSGEILWEKPKEIWTEDYTSSTINAAVEDEALDEIVSDLSESIYLGILKRLRDQDKKQVQESAVTPAE